MATRINERALASPETAYQAAQESAIFVDRSNLGMLKFSGETRLDLINRMSTQQVNNLRSGQGAATVLTTDIGRIIDRLILYVSDDHVYCLTGEQNADPVARYLMGYVFFMDDFHVEDLSADTAILGVYGRQATSLLGGMPGDDAELPLHYWRQVELDGRPLRLHRTDPIFGDGYFVTCQTSDREFLWDYLLHSGLTPAGAEAFEYLRIESGRPRFGHELTSEYIPLEAELWSDVSFNKGCYTGQEIIARMESRGRVAKRLVKLIPEAPVTAGTELTATGKRAGVITSAADGPGGPLALGYVKSSFLDDKVGLMAGSIPVQVQAILPLNS